jgi:hypothetical protein
MEDIEEFRRNTFRDNRNAFLDETDWMVVKAIESGTTIEDKWKTYRQALRDMDFSNIDNIVYPTKPE